MTLTLRELDADRDLAAQRELFALAFPETAGFPISTPEHYEWKFRTFPATPPSYEYVAEDEHGLVGYYAALPYRYQHAGGVRTFGMVCDVMTHPRARGKGIFVRLGTFATTELRERGIAATTGYPIRPEVIPGHLKVGWKIAFALPLYVKPLRATALLRSRGLGFFAPALNVALSSSRTVLGLLAPSGRYIVEIETPQFFRTKEYAGFLQDWLTSQRSALIKDSAFMSWRLAAPATEYRVLVARGGDGRVRAVSIVRRVDLQGMPSLAILDIMVSPGHLRALSAMSKALDSVAAKSGAEVVATMMSRRWARAYGMWRLGFLRTPREFSLILKSLNSTTEAKEFLDESEWHLMWIDSDDL